MSRYFSTFKAEFERSCHVCPKSPCFIVFRAVVNSTTRWQKWQSKKKGWIKESIQYNFLDRTKAIHAVWGYLLCEHLSKLRVDLVFRSATYVYYNRWGRVSQEPKGLERILVLANLHNVMMNLWFMTPRPGSSSPPNSSPRPEARLSDWLIGAPESTLRKIFVKMKALWPAVPPGNWVPEGF